MDSVQVKAGDGPWTDAAKSGSIPIELPDGGTRDYTFRVSCKSGEGEDVLFTFVLRCAHSADLELELRWQEKDGRTDSLSCIPGDTAAKTVKSRDLTEHIFLYTPVLTGSAADQAQIIKGSYTTASGGSGELSGQGGTLVLKPGQKYDMTFEVSYDGMILYFYFIID